MVFHRASMVRAAALRSSAFSLAKACSIGLKSGEYGGRYSKVARRQPRSPFSHRTNRLAPRHAPPAPARLRFTDSTAIFSGYRGAARPLIRP